MQYTFASARDSGLPRALVLATSLLAAPAWAAPVSTASAPTVVSSVDLNRYAGRWYEIARYPNRFQKQCASDVTAEYVRQPDGRIAVINRCKRADGTWDEAKGVARRAGSDPSNAKLEVRFAPAFLSFLPVWGDYWVMDLAPDYSHALVGSPDRKYFWVLARSANDPDLLTRLEPKIRELGFDPALVQATRHTASGSTE